MARRTAIPQETLEAIKDLIRSRGGDPDTFAGEMISQLIQKRDELGVLKHKVKKF